jgi:hypothetical protein
MSAKRPEYSRIRLRISSRSASDSASPRKIIFNEGQLLQSLEKAQRVDGFNDSIDPTFYNVHAITYLLKTAPIFIWIVPLPKSLQTSTTLFATFPMAARHSGLAMHHIVQIAPAAAQTTTSSTPAILKLVLGDPSADADEGEAAAPEDDEQTIPEHSRRRPGRKPLGEQTERIPFTSEHS